MISDDDIIKAINHYNEKHPNNTFTFTGTWDVTGTNIQTAALFADSTNTLTFPTDSTAFVNFTAGTM